MKDGMMEKIIYKNIDFWIKKHYYTYRKFSDEIGVSPSALHSVLVGEHYPGKYMIDGILRVTGLTYEEAFKVE